MINTKRCKTNQIIFTLIILLLIFAVSVVATCQKAYASEPQQPIDPAQLLRMVESKKPAERATAPLIGSRTSRYIQPYHDYTGQTAPPKEHPSTDTPERDTDYDNLYAPHPPQATPGFELIPTGAR